MTPTDWLADQVKFMRVCGIPGEKRLIISGAPTGPNPPTLLAPPECTRMEPLP
jgi:hypothetical protein